MATLRLGADRAREILDEQIQAGRLVRDDTSGARTREDYDAWKRTFTQWVDVTKAALTHIYDGEGEVKAFEAAATHHSFVAGGDWPEWLDDYRNDVEKGISKLESLKSALRFAEAPAPTVSNAVVAGSTPPDSKGVIFLVYGHDDRRQEVARFLEKACDNRYDVTILDEKPGRSRTLIERLERHALDVKYAVILFTGDDVGGEKAPQGHLQPRARQNVVFEFGWFCGQIGREHVAVLYEAEVELPSDVGGVTYISLDQADWTVRLVRDLRDAGLDFSLDRV